MLQLTFIFLPNSFILKNFIRVASFTEHHLYRNNSQQTNYEYSDLGIWQTFSKMSEVSLSLQEKNRQHI